MTETATSWRDRLRRVPLLFRVLFVVTLLPLAEYALLVWISETIGFTLTLLALLSSGALGAWFVRRQGLWAWNRILGQVRRGEPVGESIFDGVLILLAGVLLIMPGILSDVVGGALLFAKVRRGLRERLGTWLRNRAMMQVMRFHADGRFTMEAETEAPPPADPPVRTLDGAPLAPIGRPIEAR